MTIQNLKVVNDNEEFHRLLEVLTSSNLKYFIIRWDQRSLFAVRDEYADSSSAGCILRTEKHYPKWTSDHGPFWDGGSIKYTGWHFNCGIYNFPWTLQLSEVRKNIRTVGAITISLETDQEIKLEDFV